MTWHRAPEGYFCTHCEKKFEVKEWYFRQGGSAFCQTCRPVWRRIRYTNKSAASILQLVARAPKRIRKKYLNAVVLCGGPTNAAPALAMTNTGFGVAAYLRVGWFTLRLETVYSMVQVASSTEAIRYLREMPLADRFDRTFGLTEDESFAKFRKK